MSLQPQRVGPMSMPGNGLDANAQTLMNVELSKMTKLMDAGKHGDLINIMDQVTETDEAAKIINEVIQVRKTSEEASLNPRQVYILQNYSLDFNGVQALAKDLAAYKLEQKRKKYFDELVKKA